MKTSHASDNFTRIYFIIIPSEHANFMKQKKKKK